MLHKVDDPSRQTGNLNPDSLASLPIGIAKVIGDKRYIIAIDSATFLPNGAFFNAFMGVELPNADAPLYFAATNIQFNPKGVIGGALSKLKLISTQRVNLGPNAVLELPGDGSNYISWDCNGFQSLQLHGLVHFSDGIIVNPNNPQDSVTADFTAFVTDFNNIMASMSIEDFAIKGMNDVIFNITEAYVDMSDDLNPNGMVFPSNYQSTSPNGTQDWRGFYLKSASVTLPESFNKNGSIPNQLSAQNLIIDQSGVTGLFSASTVLPLEQGDANGWPISVNQIDVNIVQNEIVSGGIQGKLVAAQLDDREFDYTANISKSPEGQLDYMFAVSLGANETVNMNAINATLTLDQSSQIQVTKKNNKWLPKLILNGDLVAQKSGRCKLEGIAFQGLTIIPEDPYMTGGTFALVTNNPSQDNNISGFNIQLNNLQVGLLNGKLTLDVDAMMNLGVGNNSFGVSSGVQMTAVKSNDNWVAEQTKIKDVAINVVTEPFKMYGLVAFHQNDATYGTGFQGQLSFSVKNLIDTMLVKGAFGKVNDYRYWSVDFAAPVQIPLSTGMNVVYISGGMSHHMSGTKSNQQLMGSAQGANGNEVGDTYVPDQNAGLALRAGAGVDNVKEHVFNSDVVFGVSFNANGGLSNIYLDGNAYMMTKRSERQGNGNKVFGSIALSYDNNAKVFDADLSLSVQYQNIITGNAWAKVYVSPQTWYMHVGRPANRCYLSVHNVGSVDAYFMMGENLDPIPNPPPQLVAMFNNANLAQQRDVGKIASGDGIGTGMSFSSSISNTKTLFGKYGFSIYASVGAGFDMTMYKYPQGTYCSESGNQNFGMNRLYLNGQIYAYAGLNVDIFKEDGWSVNVLNANVALLLQGKLPKPTFVRGAAHVDVSIFGIGFDFEGEFSLGEECTLVN